MGENKWPTAYYCRLMLWCVRKIKLIAHSLPEPWLTFISDMPKILAENSTELISEQRSVSDLCTYYARSTKIARIYLNLYISWSEGNFRQKSREKKQHTRSNCETCDVHSFSFQSLFPLWNQKENSVTQQGFHKNIKSHILKPSCSANVKVTKPL